MTLDVLDLAFIDGLSLYKYQKNSEVDNMADEIKAVYHKKRSIYKTLELGKKAVQIVKNVSIRESDKAEFQSIGVSAGWIGSDKRFASEKQFGFIRLPLADSDMVKQFIAALIEVSDAPADKDVQAKATK
jgi:hypothetical protein